MEAFRSELEPFWVQNNNAVLGGFEFWVTDAWAIAELGFPAVADVPIAGVHRASVYNGTNLDAYSTGSYTPAANRLMIACVHSALSGVPNTPTVAGNGLTWTQFHSYSDDTAGTQHRLTAFVALSGASPSAGAVTASFASQVQDGGSVIVDQYDGADISGTALAAIVQSKSGTVDGSGTDETITLDTAIGGGNATGGLIHHQADETTVAGSGYALLGFGSHAGPSNANATVFRSDGNVIVSGNWTTSSGKGGIAWEIKVAGAAVEGDVSTSQAVAVDDTPTLAVSDAPISVVLPVVQGVAVRGPT
jgi:hypothetical protein